MALRLFAAAQNAGTVPRLPPPGAAFGARRAAMKGRSRGPTMGPGVAAPYLFRSPMHRHQTELYPAAVISLTCDGDKPSDAAAPGRATIARLVLLRLGEAE
jgi:hypothetical protein